MIPRRKKNKPPASETEAEGEDDDEDTPPEEPWCPPIPPVVDDLTELEIKGAADKLATMMNSSQPHASVFHQPDNLGALPHLWLQAKLTISLTSVHFFPSNAVWLPPGRSTSIQACCI